MKITRVGRLNCRISEYPLDPLISVHSVPRKGNEEGYARLQASLVEEGYDLRFPVHVYQMPNGDDLIASGSHRVNAMRLLGEETVPAVIHQVDEGVADRADRLMLGWLLEIGKHTGHYRTDFEVPLDNLERAQVDDLMEFWIEHNI